ncbi:7-cyano-7-deazaguanine synthase, partial [Candidatus Gribaldobacteria bacterium]|nr:7-cyano-7-deazaguanine synthase [Candidatus Gribaldobacteria bacterium]
MPFFVLIHYGEIILKGRNRGFFEKVLLVNIKQALGKEFFKTIHLGYGRFILELQDGADLSVIKNRLKQVFGIVNFAFVLKVKSKAEVIEQVGLALVLDKQFTTFKVETKRADKTFALSSQKVNARVGSLIVEKLSKKVDLEKPDLTLFIEITKKEAFLFIEKFKGLGGLPVGSSGRAIALLSGGIDSPVACYLAMKRGLEVIFCHFYSEPFSDKRSVEKAKQIISILSKYQAREKFYLIPFAEIQKEILIKTKEGLRVLLYRRA